MKKYLFPLIVVLIFVSCQFQSSAKNAYSNALLNLSDTVVFDLSAATFSNSGGVFYIDIPVLIYSNDPGINALDFWFHFNLTKMTYVSTTAVEAGLDPFTFYNSTNQVLSNTTSGTSITYSAPTYTDLLVLRFSLADACTEILSSDFSLVTALVNGNLSSYLFIGPTDVPQFEIQQPQPYCSGQDIVFSYPYNTINGRTIQSYSWDFGNGQTSSLQSDTAVYAVEGDYPVALTVTTVDGCIYTQEHVIPIYATPISAFSSSWDEPSNVVSFTNESTISTGSINLYTWDFGTSTSNLQNPSYTFPVPDYYNVTLTAISDLGCTSSITQLVTAIDIIELDSRNFHVYPNPASGNLQIESSIHITARIVDVTGRIVTKDFILQANVVKALDISFLTEGIYFIEAETDGQIYRERFMIQN